MRRLRFHNHKLSQRLGRAILQPPLLYLSWDEKGKLAHLVERVDQFEDLPERYQRMILEAEEGAAHLRLLEETAINCAEPAIGRNIREHYFHNPPLRARLVYTILHPPLSGLSLDEQARLFILVEQADSFEDLPEQYQRMILEAEERREHSRWWEQVEIPEPQ